MKKLNEFVETFSQKEAGEVKKFIYTEHLPFVFVLNNRIFQIDNDFIQIWFSGA